MAALCPRCDTEVAADARFCSACGCRLEPEAAPGDAPEPGLAPRPRDERRHVAVLFADVSGFTAMSEKLDPEAVRDLMNECFEGLGEAVREEDGHIDKYIGDCVMALFGAPVAHEDDPVRACRAALTMQRFLGRFSAECRRRVGVELRMRVGVHAGLVVAGRVGSAQVRMDYTVMGDTVNVASRLEHAAAPGTTLVSADVMRRVRGRFAFGRMQRLEVKGKEKPLEAYTLVGEASEVLPFGGGRYAARFVERDELATLLARCREPRGPRWWIELRGDVGTGKSRLASKATSRLDGDVLWALATRQSRRAPFGLAQVVLRKVFECLGGKTARRPRSLADLERTLAPLGDEPAEYAEALWHLVAPEGVPAPAPEDDPLALRRMTEIGIRCVLEGFARRAPDAFLVLDGWELADKASADLFATLGRDPDGPPLRTFVLGRPAAPPPLRPEDVVEVGPLPRGTAQRLLHVLARGAALPETLEASLLDRAGGIPLYLEELVRTLVEEGVLHEGPRPGVWVCEPEAAALRLPTSVHAAMTARLDRLAPKQRRLLCECAVQGVEFRPRVAELVWETISGEPGPVAALLGRVLTQGFVRADSAGDDAVWEFRQPLLQESCYELLLHRERRALHAATAAALVEVAGGADRVAPVELAHHYRGAEDWPRAARFRRLAAEQEAALFQHERALRSCAEVHEAFGRIERPRPEDRREDALAHGIAAETFLVRGQYDRVEAEATRMRSAAEVEADRIEAERLLAEAFWATGRGDRALALLEQAAARGRHAGAEAGEVLAHTLRTLARRYMDRERTADALRALAECRRVMPAGDALGEVQTDEAEGRVALAAGHFMRALALFARARQKAEAIGNLSVRAWAANNTGSTRRDQGDYDRAREDFLEALRLWRRMGDTKCVAGATNNLANLAMSRGDFAEARAYYEETLAAWRGLGHVHGVATACANLAIASIEEDKGVLAVVDASRALEALGETSGNAFLRGLVRVVLGEAYLACRNLARAEGVFSAVLAETDEESNPLAVAGARRGLGRVALARADRAKARALLEDALALYCRLSRVQEASRTKMHLAEALHGAGEREPARAHLAEARRELEAIGARRDVERVTDLEARLRGA